MRGLALVLALLAAGCSLAPTDDVIRELVKSERSWCVTINTVYGTARLAGTGISGGTVSCSQEGLVVRQGPPPQ